ncbi:cytochrome P450 [Amycolatopsis sp. A133]|uniref:cytochrome P450 family protein n=1 Tax=Amycolatopsis sp. A133 TaxID=3064472 RepID=UPI0027F159B5|nr:cytochrome P450 [Amycolatopsis sp. A133]MDQ7809893.1 cytochrome P450 [Amycolatopsis sp. A133]
MGEPALFGPDFDRDPSPAYAWLRERPPRRLRFPTGTWAWLITRYDDAVTALNHPALVKSPFAGHEEWQRSGMGLPLDHRPSLGSHMINADPPEHARLRRACAGAFGPRRMQSLRERAQQVTDELIDAVEARGRGDLVTDLAYPLPIAIICDLLGVPGRYREDVHEWSLVIDSADDTDGSKVREATDVLERLVTEVVEAKRATRGTDLISDLVAQEAVGTLSADEVTSTAFLILIGGHETTVGLISTGALALLNHPEEAAKARLDPQHRAAVIEETLRLHAPLQNATWRFPTEDVEIGGRVMRPGDPILVSVLAANRDPAAFEDADAFRPGQRSAKRRHIAFGAGPHLCIGAALARLQADVAFESLLRRLPAARLAVAEDDLMWWPSPITRGLFHLPIEL